MGRLYSKLTLWTKILFILMIIIIILYVFKNKKINKEGFVQQEQFVIKSGDDIYDDFYVDIYNELVYSKVKDDYEIEKIETQTKLTSKSKVLDIGCGIGHHVSLLNNKNIDVLGLDVSTSMINKAKETYPKCKFKKGNGLNTMLFEENEFTHILTLYFTIYYFKNKEMFFSNSMKWLNRGGYLIIHLVDRDNFDPILPPGNPLILISPQRYAKQRITNTKVKFNDFSYSSNFNLDKEKNIANFTEKFKNDNDGKTRKQEHMFYMEDLDTIVNDAQRAGFILNGKIDLINCQYEYQYLYIFMKPN